MLPFSPATSEALDDFMSRPSDGVLSVIDGTDGNFLVLGAGGKMGLHLCLMLQRGLKALGKDFTQRVIAVSRFGSAETRSKFESRGIDTISADLSEPKSLAALPDAPNVFFLAGVKFGTSHEPDLLEKMNVQMPRAVAERFRDSRIVALSTGCVYSFVSPESGGSTEEDATDPVGDYAVSCLGREQAFRNAGEQWGTSTALIRLNYAIDLRYGVLVDIAQKVLAGQPVDVSMGYVNVIWQGDALAHTIQALPHASEPPFVLNVTGPGNLRVRELALKFGEQFRSSAIIVGEEQSTAWLNNASKAHAMFGRPEVGIEEMVEWIASWLEGGGETLGKPTHFETRDGKY
ncbi:MAG: NAD(P)-dependent oxidoreductase [Verrucomicrobiae bacterium]|nr:NAD(P)-dependent oxidoreductase [Verrucomicrobiae bacterium]